MKVISRTSTQRYQSKARNLREIAKQLGVANIVQGSVQKAADQVRVNVQLINAQTDSHLWADSYDRKLTDILGVESDVAKRIAESLQAKLSGREEQALAAKRTNNPEAYDAYLRGLAFDTGEESASPTVHLLTKALGFYERAVHWPVQPDGRPQSLPRLSPAIYGLQLISSAGVLQERKAALPFVARL